MQKRERLLTGTIALLVGGWLLDSMVVQPTMLWFAAVEKHTRDAQRKVGEANVLIDRQSQIMTAWRTQHAAGLLDNGDQARFRLQRTLANEASASGFIIDSVSGGQVIPATNDQIYDILRLGVSGRGSHEQVTAFLAQLEQADMPLAIERSEWSSSDARKNHLDVSLTISTRMVAENARPGRSVPDGTTAWKPHQRESTFDTETIAAKPFLADRRPPRPETITKKEELAPPPPKVIDPGWALVGIVTTNRQSVGFIRHLSRAEERQIAVGETIDALTVTAINASGMMVTDSTGERHIVVGNTLLGEAIGNRFTTVAPTKTSTRSSAKSASDDKSNDKSNDPKSDPAKINATPFKVPAPNSDPAHEAILERLRQQREKK